MDFIFQLDYWLFDLINVKMSNAFFDFFLTWMRNIWIWVPFYIFIIFFAIDNFGKSCYYLLLFLILNVSISNIVSSELIKKNVKRLRPCRNENVAYVNVRINCGSGYSFTSSHATNHFALASFLVFTLGTFIRKIKWPLFLWAAIICLAQIYVGVHFPIDVLCGSVIGFTIGSSMAALYMKWYGRHTFIFKKGA